MAEQNLLNIPSGVSGDRAQVINLIIQMAKKRYEKNLPELRSRAASYGASSPEIYAQELEAQGNLDQQMHWRSGYDEWDMFLRLSNGGSFGEKSPSKNRVNSGNPSYLAKIMETLSQALNEDSRKVQRLDRQIVLSNMN